MKKNVKLIYNNVEKGIIGIHLFACLFISGNIFFILLAMIGSLIIMKLCEISVSFIYTIPFITEDDRRRIAEKDRSNFHDCSSVLAILNNSSILRVHDSKVIRLKASKDTISPVFKETIG